MASKKLSQLGILIGGLLITLGCHAEVFPYPGQTLQINTHLDSMVGQPEWLLIIRDVDSGIVIPYLFDFKENDNFWVAFATARNYKVTVSNLNFGRLGVITNFC